MNNGLKVFLILTIAADPRLLETTIVKMKEQWITSFKKVSINGRYAYGLVCLENAFQKEKVHHAQMKPLVDFLWTFTTSSKLDLWQGEVDELCPETILDSRTDFHDLDILSYDEAVLYKSFYESLPAYLIELIDTVMWIGLSNLYVGIGTYSSSSYEQLVILVSLCEENKVPQPALDVFQASSFNEMNGWGKSRPRSHWVE